MTRNLSCALCVLMLVLFQSAALYAQAEFQIKGVVLERGTKDRIASAQIINKRNKFNVISDNLGIFQIKGLVGDTLLIVKSTYSDAEVRIIDTKDVVVYLTGGNLLKEVVITGETKKQELDGLKRDYRNKGSFYQGKPPFLSFIFTPLTAVYELFGRTPKNARRFGKYYTNELEQTHIDGFFNEFSVKKHTNLEGKELEDFMLNYRPEYEKAKNWAEYDAIKYIRDSYKNYVNTLKK